MVSKFKYKYLWLVQNNLMGLRLGKLQIKKIIFGIVIEFYFFDHLQMVWLKNIM